jgi:hypothetical protein
VILCLPEVLGAPQTQTQPEVGIVVIRGHINAALEGCPCLGVPRGIKECSRPSLECGPRGRIFGQDALQEQQTRVGITALEEVDGSAIPVICAAFGRTIRVLVHGAYRVTASTAASIRRLT